MFSQLNGPAADPPAALSLFVPQCGGQMRTDGRGGAGQYLLAVSLVLLTSGMGGPFVRPETGGVE